MSNERQLSWLTRRAGPYGAALLVAVASCVIGITAWLVLPYWQEHQAVRRLIQTLGNDEADALQGAIAAVKKFHDGEAAIEPLIRELQSKNEDTVWDTEVALAQIGPIAGDPLIRRMRDTNEHYRIRAGSARSLGKMRLKTAVPALVDLLHDQDPRIRAWSAWSLSHLAPESRIALLDLIVLLKDEHPMPRRFAALACYELGHDALEAIEPLVEATRDPDNDTRVWAIDALGNIGPKAKDAIPSLFECRSDVRCRIHAVEAITQIGLEDESVILTIANLLDDEDPHVRAAVLRSLRSIGPKATCAIPKILKLTSDATSGAAAKMALDKIMEAPAERAVEP